MSFPAIPTGIRPGNIVWESGQTLDSFSRWCADSKFERVVTRWDLAGDCWYRDYHGTGQAHHTAGYICEISSSELCDQPPEEVTNSRIEMDAPGIGVR